MALSFEFDLGRERREREALAQQKELAEFQSGLVDARADRAAERQLKADILPRLAAHAINTMRAGDPVAGNAAVSEFMRAAETIGLRGESPTTMAARAVPRIKFTGGPGTQFFSEFGEQIAAVPGSQAPLVQIDRPPGETSAEKGMGTLRVETFKNVLKSANEASMQMALVNRTSQMLERIHEAGGQTGFGTGAGLLVKRIAKAANIDPESLGLADDSAPLEALQSLQTRFALQHADKTKGAISDREMGMFVDAAPGLMRTMEGNKLLLELERRMAEFAIGAGDVVREFQRKHGDKLTGFDKDGDQVDVHSALAKFHKENPLFTEEISNHVARLTGFNPGRQRQADELDEKLRKHGVKIIR